MTDKIVKSEAEWRALLTAEQYYGTREHGTSAFTGALDKHYGWHYRCVCCGDGAVLLGHQVQLRQRMAEFLRQAGPRGCRRDRGNGFFMRRPRCTATRTAMLISRHVLEMARAPTRALRCRGSTRPRAEDSTTDRRVRRCVDALKAGVIPAMMPVPSHPARQLVARQQAVTVGIHAREHGNKAPAELVRRAPRHRRQGDRSARGYVPEARPSSAHRRRQRPAWAALTSRL